MLTLLQLPLGPGLPTAILTAAPTRSAIVAASELPPLVVVAMGTTLGRTAIAVTTFQRDVMLICLCSPCERCVYSRRLVKSLAGHPGK